MCAYILARLFSLVHNHSSKQNHSSRIHTTWRRISSVMENVCSFLFTDNILPPPPVGKCTKHFVGGTRLDAYIAENRHGLSLLLWILWKHPERERVHTSCSCCRKYFWSLGDFYLQTKQTSFLFFFPTHFVLKSPGSQTSTPRVYSCTHRIL